MLWLPGMLPRLAALGLLGGHKDASCLNFLEQRGPSGQGQPVVRAFLWKGWSGAGVTKKSQSSCREHMTQSPGAGKGRREQPARFRWLRDHERENGQQAIGPHLVGRGGDLKHKSWTSSRSMGDGHSAGWWPLFKAALPGLQHQNVSSCAPVRRECPLRPQLLRGLRGLHRGPDSAWQVVFGGAQRKEGHLWCLCGGVLLHT